MRREYTHGSMTTSEYIRSKGYQTVESMNNMGLQSYIDTGFIPDNQTELQCYVSAPSNVVRRWFGIQWKATDNSDARYMLYSDGSGLGYIGYNFQTGSIYVRYNFTANQIVKVNFKNNGQVYYNDVLTGTVNRKTVPDRSLVLLGANWQSTQRVTVDKGAKLHYDFILTDGSEELMHLYPCYSLTDNSITGYYDMISDTFIQSSNGSLNKGADYNYD